MFFNVYAFTAIGKGKDAKRMFPRIAFVRSIIHNMVAHPLLPIAEVLDSTKYHVVANGIYWLHDVTVLDDKDPHERYV